MPRQLYDEYTVVQAIREAVNFNDVGFHAPTEHLLQRPGETNEAFVARVHDTPLPRVLKLQSKIPAGAIVLQGGLIVDEKFEEGDGKSSKVSLGFGPLEDGITVDADKDASPYGEDIVYAPLAPKFMYNSHLDRELWLRLEGEPKAGHVIVLITYIAKHPDAVGAIVGFQEYPKHLGGGVTVHSKEEEDEYKDAHKEDVETPVAPVKSPSPTAKSPPPVMATNKNTPPTPPTPPT